MRPFIQYSFKKLEEEFYKARAAGDISLLHKVQIELNARTRNSNTPVLKAAIAAAIDALKPVEGAEIVQPLRSPVATEPAARSSAPARRSLLKPTAEQIDAIDAFKAGKHLKINAYAGSGKTSTLQMLAHETRASGQYIAFNRYIVADAKEKFPPSVNCSTSHSLAMRATPSAYKQKMDKLTGKVNANQLTELMQLKHRKFGDSLVLNPRSQAFLYLDTIRRYAQSAEEDLSIDHVPSHGSMQAAPDDVVAAIKEFALRGATQVWSKMLDPNDPLPMGHDGYLKLWGLSQPKILADFILLDEAQDTNPVVLDVLKRQSAQMIYVGDRYQQIYEWRGAINAMEEIATEHDAFLTTSFRFGNSIAELATKTLRMLGESRVLTGNSLIHSKLVSSFSTEAILARTNASTISAVISALDTNARPHLVGGTKELMELLRGVQMLKAGQPCDVPDFFGFSSWNEVVDYAKSDEGGHLLTFVNLVEAKGEKQLMWALGRTVSEDQADITISTAHKAKGREWRSVSLMDDFVRSMPGMQHSIPDAAELRLLYVAMTRAKELMVVPPSVRELLSVQVPVAQPSAASIPPNPTPTRQATNLPQRQTTLLSGVPNAGVSAPTKAMPEPERRSVHQAEQQKMPPKKIGFWQRLFGL